MSSVTKFVIARVRERLDTSRVVVWYDAAGAFAEVVAGLTLPECHVVRWDGSVLRTRRAAEEAYAGLFPDDEPGARGPRLLLYLPRAHDFHAERRRQDPLEVFALVGRTFGDAPAETYEALAIAAMPEHEEAIAALFAQGTPPLSQLEGLARGSSRPALGTALGTEAAVEAAALLLCRPEQAARVEETLGAKPELLEALEREFGFRVAGSVPLGGVLAALARYVLLSELLFDLPGELPASLTSAPHAEAAQRGRVYALCDRMRTDDALRPGYIERAVAVERELSIPAEIAAIAELGQRDTFACEERRYFGTLVRDVAAGDLAAAERTIAGRAGSVWRNHEERAVLWKVAERCVRFLQVANEVEAALLPASASVGAWVSRYTAEDGAWRLDQHQRLFEQSETEAGHDEQIERLIAVCRQRYLAVSETMQGRFLAAVVREGWPPDGVQRHVQTFARAVQPELEAGQRVAYFFVDAMRYEMGAALRTDLASLGETRLTPVANVLPATTPCGMAALLPGAETSYRLVQAGSDVVPAVGGKELPNSKARMAYFQEQFGDRFAEADLDEVLSTTEARLKAKTQGKTLFVVRTQDIDGIGENMSGYQARKLLSGVLGDLRRATQRLMRAGFSAFVYIGDHGHVLLPDETAGDRVPKPPGEWLKEKRRSLVGIAQGKGGNVQVLATGHLGITTDVPDFAVAPGFCVFTSGHTYFHEGISLQECVVPLVVLHARAAEGGGGATKVVLSYRADRFTSYIVSIKARAEATLDAALGGGIQVRIEAYAGTGARAQSVGEAADCDARDPETRLVTLRPGEETPVPVRIEDGVAAETVEIRAIDPNTEKVLGALRLQNAVQE